MNPALSLEEAIHARVLADPTPDVAAAAHRHARSTAPLLADTDLDALVARVLDRVHGLGPLDDLLRDPAVTEVMVNGGTEVWVERRGRLDRVPLRLAPGQAEQLIERVVAPLGLRVDRTSPIVDARLADGSRVHAVVPPLAVDGPCLTIRRFARRAVPLDDFAAPPVVALLRWAVTARANLIVSGATSSGKTTLLNALAAELPPGERVITIEDAAELRLPGDHVVRLETRPATAEGLGAVSVRELVRAALRMRPDRILVGEVRGAEALDMVLAMNTGHDGSLSTLHANSADDALRRLDTLVLQAATLPLAAVREQVQASVDLVVHVARSSDGARAIREVAEVLPAAGDPPDRHGPAFGRTRRLADERTVLAEPTRGDRRGPVGGEMRR